MLLADTILAALVTAGLLMLIFKTTAIEEYASLLKLDSFLGLDRWRVERSVPPAFTPPACPSCKPAPVPPPREPIQYMTWARSKAAVRPPGFVRWFFMLITCPFCVGLWIALAASLVLIQPWPIALVCAPATYALSIVIFRRLL